MTPQPQDLPTLPWRDLGHSTCAPGAFQEQDPYAAQAPELRGQGAVLPV